jgi:hypothetical protein
MKLKLAIVDLRWFIVYEPFFSAIVGTPWHKPLTMFVANVDITLIIKSQRDRKVQVGYPQNVLNRTASRSREKEYASRRLLRFP